MPLPQADELTPADSSSGSDAATGPKLQFSCVECLMYTFHQVARRCPQFLTAEENADRLKDFRMRWLIFLPFIDLSSRSICLLTVAITCEPSHFVSVLLYNFSFCKPLVVFVSLRSIDRSNDVYS